ncbi:hypothetical protein YC2023_004603 [Brassica napus]
MDPVIIVSGKWIMKKRYVFNVDSRGCRVLHLGEKTKLEDFTKSVIDDYGLNDLKVHILLSYMFSNKTLKTMAHNKNGSYDGCSLEDEQDEIENDCFSNVLKLEMSSLDLAVGELYKNFLGDVGPAVCPESVGIAITKQFGVKVIMLQRLSYVRV